jgi:hypothetical protein
MAKWPDYWPEPAKAPTPAEKAAFRAEAAAKKRLAIEREVERLLPICRERGVQAALAEGQYGQELLRRLADACLVAGLKKDAQYLTYLSQIDPS